MRAFGRRLLVATVAGVAFFLSLTATWAPEARAEAPFFYDPLGPHAVYDPEFYPLNRATGFLSVIAQGWSRPDPADPSEDLLDQEYEGQYRLLWNLALDPAYSLKVELKASTRDQVVANDYFLRSEFMYQGLEAPLYLYGGIKLPEEGDFLVYAGLESMSYTLMDILPSTSLNLPVGFRGFGEVHTLVEGEDDPTLRLMVLAHTLPEIGVENLTLSAGIDAFFKENVNPTWLFEGHAEYRLFNGFVRWNILTGYMLDLVSDEQRLSVGVQAELF